MESGRLFAETYVDSDSSLLAYGFVDRLQPLLQALSFPWRDYGRLGTITFSNTIREQWRISGAVQSRYAGES